MRQLYAAGGTALFFAVAPGVVAGVVPWALTDWRLEGDLPIGVRAIGAATALVAGVLLADSFVRFRRRGGGHTGAAGCDGAARRRRPLPPRPQPDVPGCPDRDPRPGAPSRQPVLVLYAVGVTAAVVSFVRWYEEPTLRRRFGPDYDRYRAAVPGWWPRLTPARPLDDGAVVDGR
jgi:hypothetical protein